MNSPKTVCIFVDGENLRHSIVDLFPFPTFNQKDYLPKTDWAAFFDWIAVQVVGPDADRIRTYWYVVQNIDCSPDGLKNFCSFKNRAGLQYLLLKNPIWKTKFDAVAGNISSEDSVLHEFANYLYEGRQAIKDRFDGWTHIQNEIAGKNNSIEFRRAGAIRYDLLTRLLGSEKSVDVKLATDMILLKDMYDVAIVVSGDQDYVPAVEAVKNYGKKVISVAFLTSNNKVLPGGARRLNHVTDSNFLIGHADLKTHLGL